MILLQTSYAQIARSPEGHFGNPQAAMIAKTEPNESLSGYQATFMKNTAVFFRTSS
jgi:hypothetical protein